MILSEVGIPIGPVLAGFGVAGIAVGFGAQYLIRDLIAGVFVLMESQYRMGDDQTFRLVSSVPSVGLVLVLIKSTCLIARQ